MKVRAIALLAAASALCGQAATAHPKVENKAPANLVDIHSPIDSLTFRTHVSYRIKTPKGNTLIVPALAPLPKVILPTPTPVTFTATDVNVLSGGNMPSTPVPATGSAASAAPNVVTSGAAQRPTIMPLPKGIQARSGPGRYNVIVEEGETLAAKLRELDAARPGQDCLDLYQEMPSERSSTVIFLVQCSPKEIVHTPPLPAGVEDMGNDRYQITGNRITFERRLGELEAVRPPGLLCQRLEQSGDKTLVHCNKKSWDKEKCLPVEPEDPAQEARGAPPGPLVK